MSLKIGAVWVTRPAGQADKFIAGLNEFGLAYWHAPLLRISPIDHVMEEVDSDWWVFVSQNAVRRALQIGYRPSSDTKIAAIGPATADALAAENWPIHAVPNQQPNTEGLLALESFVPKEKVSIFAGVGGRRKLEQSLAGKGVEVQRVELYKREALAVDTVQIEQWMSPWNAPVLVAITSGEALKQLASIWAKRNQALLLGGKRLEKMAEALGYTGKMLVADDPSDESMLAIIGKLIKGQND